MEHPECEELKTFMIPPRSWGYTRGEERERYLEKLLEIAKRTGNSCAWGFIHYIKSGKYYDVGDFLHGYQEAQDALAYGKACGDWWVMAMALNNIGVFHTQQENIITAFDYYLRAINCLYESEQDDAPLLYMLYGNVAECMLAVGEYEKAMAYLERLDRLDVPSDFIHAPMNQAFVSHNKIECDYMMGNYYEAWKYVLEMEALEREHEETKILHYSLLVWKYMVLHALGRRGNYDSIRRELREFQLGSSGLSSLKKLCEFLYHTREFDFLREMLTFFEEEAERQSNIAFRLYAAGLWIKYMEEAGEKQSYYDKCALFFQLQQQRKEQEAEIRSASFYTIMAVAERADEQRELARDHELLRKKYERDELTGIPNRYRLKEFCLEAFAKTAANGETLSIEILDVDCFKELNDTYGHPRGDECLKAVAEQISEALGEGDLGARYGGDEFIIVRPGRTDEEMEELMELLRKRIMALNIPNEHSTALPVVTISQGAVNRIPRKGENLDSYLKLADMALYCSKREKKNAYRLYREDMDQDGVFEEKD